MVKRYLVAAVIVSALFFVTKTATGDLADFKNFLRDHQVVKIYVDIKNSSGDDKVGIDKLKKLLENAFAERKAHKFIVANTAEDADLIFKGDIMEYVWMEEDPVDQVWDVGAAAIDAAMIENYARMQVQSSFVIGKNNRILWSDKVKATMTQRVMPKESSYELTYSRFIKAIMIEIFKKRATGAM